MSVPSNPDAPENKPSATDTVNRDPSYPDRARIDSDVRAFLRPVSTPWIVFDRDSRVDDFAKSALRVGAVFASSPSFRPEVIKAAEAIGKPVEEVANMPLALPPLDPPPRPQAAAELLVREDAFRAGALLTPAMSSVLPDHGVFPASPPSPESAVEPSNMVVASDVVSDSSSVAISGDVRSAMASEPFGGVPGLPKRTRVGAIAAALAGALALVGATAFVASGGVRSHAIAVTTTPEVEAAAAAIPSPPETLELGGSAPAVSAPSLPSSSSSSPSSGDEAPVAKAAPASKVRTDPKKRFGRLTIKSEAKHKNVWFDGKRMLGSGKRSFVVFCGMHTIAVADKADAKDIEVPCNGEYVVSK